MPAAPSPEYRLTPSPPRRPPLETAFPCCFEMKKRPLRLFSHGRSLARARSFTLASLLFPSAFSTSYARYAE